MPTALLLLTPEAAAATDWGQAVLVDRWPWWVGGVAIGGFAVAFLLLGNRVLGVSTGFEDACAAVLDPGARRSWRLPFLAGLVLGGLASAVLAGGWHPSFDAGTLDALGVTLPAKAVMFTLGGVLVGYGSRLAGGCTSGHSISGIAQLAPSSIISTMGFMGTGLLVANLLLRSLGA